MPDLKPSDLVPTVKRVLLNAEKDRHGNPSFLTAYQILDRISPRKRRQLAFQRKGLGGKGTGNTYAAATVIAMAARMVPEATVAYLDVTGLELTLGGQQKKKSQKTFAIFRIERPTRTRRTLRRRGAGSTGETSGS